MFDFQYFTNLVFEKTTRSAKVKWLTDNKLLYTDMLLIFNNLISFKYFGENGYRRNCEEELCKYNC